MSSTNIHPAAPKLRFPIGTEPFVRERLDGIVSKKISYGIVQAGDHVPDGMPYIKSQDLNGPLRLEGLQRTSAAIAKKYKRSEVVPGDIVFSLRGNIGIAQIVPASIPVSNLTQGTARISVQDHDNKYVCLALQTKDVWKQVQAFAKGSTFREISLDDLRKVTVSIPTLPEQQKIADFLTAVDKRIQQLNQKKALLEHYKQGVTQQLFTKALRFKDDHGNEFPHWGEVAIGDVADPAKKWSFTGGPFGSNLKSEDYTETGVRIIQLQNIGDGEFLNSYRIYTSVQKADELLSCNIYPGDIILSKMGDPVARACIIPKFEKRYVMCSDGIRLAVDESRFHPYFVFSQINHRTFRNSAITVGTGSTRKRIGLTELRELPLVAPSLPEQTKIANFLSALDRKIETVATQITHTQTFKKGLLQQMFV